MEIVGNWRKLHNENFRNFNFSPGIIIVSKLRMTRLADYAARREGKCLQIVGRKPEHEYHSEDLDVM